MRQLTFEELNQAINKDTKTQRDLVVSKLREEGVVSNLWAWNNQIWRLGARIHDLRQEGWNIRTEYKNETGKKNCHYYLDGVPA